MLIDPSPEQRLGRQGSLRRHGRRYVLVTILLAVVATSAAMMRGSASSGQVGPRLTHRVTRGDLAVTVTEQGTLESSTNTEVKCKVRGGRIPILWVIPSGSVVQPGDELARLETHEFDERLSNVSKYVHLIRSQVERSRANVARAELAVLEYREGRYPAEMKTLEKDLAIAESNLRAAQNILSHTEMLATRDYVSDLDVEEASFAVTQAALNVEVKTTEIQVLKDYDQAMELETLSGDLKASRAQHEAAKERYKSLSVQFKLCEGDLAHCVVRAERAGMVVYPTAEPWKHVPEIEEGATVHMGQTLLLMPDLANMQVKIGVDESTVKRVTPGLVARVTLPDKTLAGEVISVASVTGPAGWWNGNAVKYDTVIKLPSGERLKPGMSADVEVIVAEHDDVLIVPVAAVVAAEAGSFCWIRSRRGTERRVLQLGDTNEVFSVVLAGLEEGDEVILHPLALPDAQALLQESSDQAAQKALEALKAGTPGSQAAPSKPDSSKKQRPDPGQKDGPRAKR